MSALRDDLERLKATTNGRQADVYRVPKGWEPSVSYGPGGTAELTTLGIGTPVEDDWTEEVRELGVTVPDGYVCRLVEVRHDPGAWVRRGQGEDAVTESITRRRWKVEPATSRLKIEDLLQAIGRRRPKARAPQTGVLPSFVHGVADWQLGKQAYGIGTDVTIQKVYDSLERALALHKAKRRQGLGDVLLPVLGDVCEGVTSQKGAVALSSDLTLTEQVRLYRRMLLEHIQAFAPLTDRLVVPIAPGNHDQPHRLLGGTPRGDDSWAVEGAIAVADALALAGGYDHVEIVVPDVDELTVTVQSAGTVVGVAHGHQFRAGKGLEWLSGQALSRTRVGQADVLLTGHYHTFGTTFENNRHWVQYPTQDPGSPWYDQMHGGGAQPGGAVLTLLDGKPQSLEWV